MKRRLRKKRRRGEFAEFGFDVRFRHPSARPGEPEEIALLDGFCDAVDARQLQCGGGGDRDGRMFLYVTACGCRRCRAARRARTGRAVPPGGCTEADREALRAWLTGHGAADVVVDALTDAWHPPPERPAAKAG